MNFRAGNSSCAEYKMQYYDEVGTAAPLQHAVSAGNHGCSSNCGPLGEVQSA